MPKTRLCKSTQQHPAAKQLLKQLSSSSGYSTNTILTSLQNGKTQTSIHKLLNNVLPAHSATSVPQKEGNILDTSLSQLNDVWEQTERKEATKERDKLKVLLDHNHQLQLELERDKRTLVGQEKDFEREKHDFRKLQDQFSLQQQQFAEDKKRLVTVDEEREQLRQDRIAIFTLQSNLHNQKEFLTHQKEQYEREQSALLTALERIKETREELGLSKITVEEEQKRLNMREQALAQEICKLESDKLQSLQDYKKLEQKLQGEKRDVKAHTIQVDHLHSALKDEKAKLAKQRVEWAATKIEEQRLFNELLTKKKEVQQSIIELEMQRAELIASISAL
jgi:hypothetical protein